MVRTLVEDAVWVGLGSASKPDNGYVTRRATHKGEIFAVARAFGRADAT